MQPVKIVMRNIPDAPVLEQHIRRKAEKLGQFYNRILNFHVVVEVPQKHKRQGNLFNVRIDLNVPGKALAVNRKLNEDVYVAIREAFDALIRQLETYVRKRRGDIKNHDSANFGYVTKLFPDEGYGFIQSMDGNELYFSTTNVTHPSFEQLMIGDAVQFLGITGPEGWQAHRVTKEKKSNLTEDLDS